MSAKLESRDCLVLGTAIGYNEKQIEPFLLSLRKSGYHGDIALVTTADAADALGQLPLFNGVHFVPATEWAPNRSALFRIKRYGRYLWMPLQTLEWLATRSLSAIPLRQAQSWRFAMAKAVFHPQLSRFFHYLDFLQKTEHSRIMLTDVRDVYFQHDPFSGIPTHGLCVSLENPGYTVRDEYWNSKWIRLAYGAHTLENIGGNPVSCAGVTFGDRRSMLSYLELMTAELLRAPLSAFVLQADQGMHNYLVWTGKLGKPHTLPTLSSVVATMNAMDESALKFDPSGNLLNHDLSPVNVVHQYDRLPGLSRALLNRLSA